MSFSIDRQTWILMGEIDNESGLKILSAFAEADPQKSIMFYIHSDGGDALLTLALYHELSKLSLLETRSLGHCASAALHLLQSGHERSATPYTTFLTHPLSADFQDLESNAAPSCASQFARDGLNWATVLARRTRHKTLRFWRDFLAIERHFGAREALKLGLIDRIY